MEDEKKLVTQEQRTKIIDAIRNLCAIKDDIPGSVRNGYRRIIDDENISRYDLAEAFYWDGFIRMIDIIEKFAPDLDLHEREKNREYIIKHRYDHSVALAYKNLKREDDGKE